jgi:hypothetical protein
MYYAEEVINGVLCYRNRPYGPWYPVSRETMTSRLLAAEAQAKAQRRPDAEQMRLDHERWMLEGA